MITHRDSAGIAQRTLLVLAGIIGGIMFLLIA